MSAPQFTPGPWYLTQSEAGAPRYVREEASDAVLAYIEDGGHVDPQFALSEEEQLANGSLMAAAADLYTRGVDLLDMIDAQERGRTPIPKRESDDDANSRDERDQVFAEAVEAFRAVIIKAGGER